jgi:hypothetical protein
MNKNIIDSVIENLEKDHKVFLVKKTKNTLTFKSSANIEHKISLNFSTKIFPLLLNKNVFDEVKIKTLTTHVLSSLIFFEEVCNDKKSGIENFSVIRFPLKSMDDVHALIEMDKNDELKNLF